ncbi:hypothetical protein CDAR_283951 [Caerostris darwini]|uniref:Uncharacterized protein n=1 Tax=Caerostris darwini TaxID=1538125 RepID=A0AAV4PMF6_9ARAC|nr:hypothetical protein CDAR_283951 [Caerostris darwini]
MENVALDATVFIKSEGFLVLRKLGMDKCLKEKDCLHKTLSAVVVWAWRDRNTADCKVVLVAKRSVGLLNIDVFQVSECRRRLARRNGNTADVNGVLIAKKISRSVGL